MNITLVLVEKEVIKFQSLKNEDEISFTATSEWNPKNYLDDSSGQRFVEELCLRLLKFWKMNNLEDELILISMPGTIVENKILLSSSRIGVFAKINLSEIIAERLNKDCYLFHDTECISLGEFTYGQIKFEEKKTLIYLLIDEGVGAKIYINGQCFNGNGTAGSISRLIVQKDGRYHPNLKSQGVLESYVSRPEVSKKLVEKYEYYLNHDSDSITDFKKNSKFIQAINTALTYKNSEMISYTRINEGIKDNDKIAIEVIEESASYLGYCLHMLISILAPDFILIGGRMMTEIPFFYSKSIEYAKKYTWLNGWKGTEIYLSEERENMQVYGALLLYDKLTNIG